MGKSANSRAPVHSLLYDQRPGTREQRGSVASMRGASTFCRWSLPIFSLSLGRVARGTSVAKGRKGAFR